MIVAIDGPAAAGKSTVARALAQRYGLAYLDTGAMYRAIAVVALRRGIDVGDSAALTDLAAEVEVTFEHESGSGLPTRVLVDGHDVTSDIRSPEVDVAVSPVSAVAGVRAALVEQQRRIAGSAANTVLEGRDIGTVVFPNADVKIFLTASTHERANRRTIDMVHRGEPLTHEQVKAKLESRDEYDSTREASPLLCAANAFELDTTGMSVDEVVDAIGALVEEKR